MARLNCSNQTFQRALDEAGRGEPAASDGDRPPLTRPSWRVWADFGTARGGGGEARWDLAMDWTSEPAAPPTLAASAAVGEPVTSHLDTTVSIAEELGIGAALTRHQLILRWRDFVWRNHPDRQPEHARERATARVAVANALFDRARRQLAGDR